MHSHHSHSGDYVSHALDGLDAMAAKAVALGFQIFCLTEHQPRLSSDYLYPEETEKAYEVSDLKKDFSNFFCHAKKIQQQHEKLNSATKFLVGFEVEAIDEQHIHYANEILQSQKFDLCVGSVHFVRSIPIDFDKKLWKKAMEACDGVYGLFSAYFDLQYQMISEMKPSVIGHFDLIYLMSDDVKDPASGKKVQSELSIKHDWPKIWDKVVRNIKFVKSYGGVFELNSASLRKGWSTPYPGKELAQAICEYGDARFCLSDDSHSVAQIGLNYGKVLNYIDELQLQKLYYLDLKDGKTVVESMSIDMVKHNKFWDQFS